MKKYLLPKHGNFYKANLHCHSTCSDGCWTPEQIKEEYKKRGYSIVAYTDHNVLLSHKELADSKFLPLNGFEANITDKGDDPERAKTCHLCFIAKKKDNLTMPFWHRSKYLFAGAVEHCGEVIFDENEPDFERIYTPECVNEMIKKGKDKGFFVTYNHPTWSLEDYSEYMSYKGMDAMEIYNNGCMVLGYPEYNDRVYNDMLRGGKRIFCLSTDDNHNRPDLHMDSFGGFTMIKAEKLEYETITDALEKGNFYASEGPEIYELYIEDNTVHIKCSPARRVQCTTATRSMRARFEENGVPVTEAEFVVPDSKIFFRITVEDSEGRKADTNAYFLDEI